MNIAFYIIGLILIALIWIGLSSIFEPIGEYTLGILRYIKDIMHRDEHQNNERKEDNIES